MALHSAESQSQLSCASESSLPEEVVQLQSDETWPEEQCELENGCGALIHHLQDSARETSSNWLENLGELKVQYDQVFAYLRNEGNSLLVQLATYNSCIEANMRVFTWPIRV